MSSISIGGLISGLDTNSIIDALMSVERQGLTRLNKQKSQILARQQAYRDLNTKMLSLQTAAKALSNSDSVMAYKATPADATKLTTSADSTAAAGLYSVSILNRSTQTKLTGASDVGKKIDPAAALNSADAFGSSFVGGTFTINGNQFTVSASDTLNSVLATIDATGDLSASYSAANDTVDISNSGSALLIGSAADTSNFLTMLKVASDTSGPDYTSTSSSKLGHLNSSATMNAAGANGLRSSTAVDNGGAGDGSLSINGVAIAYNVETDSLSNVLSRINNSSAGVTASFDPTTDRLLLTNKTGGTTGITVADTKGNFASALGLTSGTSLTLGSNAQITINGGTTISSTDDVFTAAETGIQGLSLTLKDDTGTTSVSVASDSDAMKTKFDTFVSAYNSVMNFIEDKTKVTGKGKDAVVGALHGMQDVTALQRQMRSTLSQAVAGISGGPSTLAGIGLGTTGQSATISLDTTKLNSALTNYAGNVQEILADTTNGVMVKLSSFIDSQTLYGNGPLAQKADRLEPSVKRADKSITQFNERLELMEARLTKQFAAMEKAMSQLQQGVGSLFSQLGVSQQ